jgi:hypothetical protein|uniref:Uncharacterized protein n=1 Tax=viral metagenome TaxID=1070528 RepID=A0A6C0DUE1_9ZZZZ
MECENPRSVSDIIPQLLAVIPETEKNLICDIKEFEKNLWNQAPEALRSSSFWVPLGNIFNKHIHNIDTDWKLKLLKIFNNSE